DGELDPGEACDDGNLDDDDDCTSLCQYLLCGDGIVQPLNGEACDDGNFEADDDCTDCQIAVCGDGTVQFSKGEQCDDANEVDDDECTNACQSATCGDGLIQISNGEQCDDANDDNTDECTNACQLAYCGDNIVGPGEECDDGNANNIAGPCLLQCIVSTCGDGIKQPHEQCDDGNDNDEDACLSTICYDATCGDGHLWVGQEQCDDGNNDPDDGCNALCGVPKRVFQSSDLYAPLDLGGVAGAGAICQALADAVNLGGVWDAWISDDNSSPSTRFTQSPTGYARLDDVEIAQNWDDLVDGTIDAPIRINELGIDWGNTQIWTATTTAGTPAAFNCNGWTTNSNQVIATLGLAGYTDLSWTDTNLGPPEVVDYCFGENRLYCFEQ
ncbi:MAG TPA: DUF4215 domain-containing protein, partial [Enhygromyxa sp.]|nr:DUF4215 domain-containing protein [Enhygromyxa sp.]